MSKINENFDSIYKNIKNLLKIAVKSRDHPYHTPVFTNIIENKIVESRIVVLRNFEEENLNLNFHTDFRSPKVKNMKKNNNSYLLFYDHTIKIQLRIKTLSKINNKNAISKKAWGLTNLSSRKCYLSQMPPSSSTSKAGDSIPEHLIGINPSKDESEKGYKNFAVIQNKILNIDWLYLASSGHRRLNINFENKVPVFSWLIP